jgi:hypothetical protein
MPFNSENIRHWRAVFQGRHRAEFWRKLGHPNLILARNARAIKRANAKASAFSPFGAIDLDLQSSEHDRKPKRPNKR